MHVFGDHDRERQIRIRPNDLFNSNLHLEDIEEKLTEELDLRANEFSENNNPKK